MFVVSESSLKRFVINSKPHKSLFKAIVLVRELVALLLSQIRAVVLAFLVSLIALILLIVLPFLRYDCKRPYL